VSLDDDVEGAKSLALSAPDIADGVRRVANAKLELTAIIQPLRAIGEELERVDRYHFAVETMERQQIRVLTVNDLERLATTARTDLRIE
jgi:hypothetical protein